MTKPKLTREAFKKMSDAFHDRNTLCPDRCLAGFIAPDPGDIDSYTGEPRTSHCPTCKGSGFIPRQLELFPDYKASPENE